MSPSARGARRIRRGLPLVLAGVLAAAAGGCSRESPRARERPREAAVATASPGADGVQRVTVTGDDSFRFSPATIYAKPGRIAISLHDSGSTPHDMVFRLFGAGVPNVEAGKTRTAVFTVAEPGTYAFSCSYHQDFGMTGKLVVRR